MSLNGLRIGGQCPSPPPTPRDYMILTVWVVVILAVVFGPLIVGVFG